MGKDRQAAQPPAVRYQQLLTLGQRRLEMAVAPAGPWDSLAAQFRARRAAGDTIGHRQFCAEQGLTHAEYLEFAASLRRPNTPDYYARPEVQQALTTWATDRWVVGDYRQGTLGMGFPHPEDILPLAAASDDATPSFHASVGRYSEDQLVAFNLVAEVDYKGDWRTCFAVIYPLIEVMHQHGLTFLVKYSGHSSAHVVVPCRGEQYAAAHAVFRVLVEHALRRTERLDRTFRGPQRLLRMPYALHERTGLVSLPLTLAEYEQFDPAMARPENVRIDQARLEPMVTTDNLPTLLAWRDGHDQASRTLRRLFR